MYSLLAYIAQVNILLIIVYIGYYVLLRKLTFYRLNRGYFLVGVVFAFAYPFLDIKTLVRQHIEPVGEWMTYLPDFYMQQVEESVYTLENAIYSSVAVVGLWFAIRFCIQLLSLLRIHLYSRKAIWKTYWYQDVLFPIVPFSFLNKIYLHKEQHQEPELYDIFEHEDIHVKGLHSMDILMFEILRIVCWYNPFVWFMRRAVRQNLEYLTDQQVLNKGVDRQTYQYSLLQVSKQGASIGLSNQFNFKFLKKRIMMMNKKKSSKLELSKYAFLLPIVIFTAGAFTISKADSRIAEAVEVARDFKLDVFKPDNREGKPEDRGKILERTIVATDTVEEERVTDTTPRIQIVGGTGDVEDHLRKLDSRADIDQRKDYLYVYDNQVISKAEFLQKDNSELYDLRLGSVRWMQLQFPNSPNKEGVVSALSKEGYDRRQEDMKKILYVIDGVVQKEGRAALDVLDPNTIESVEVLKDASAQSIYGENAKHGVIKITTKKENDGRVGVKGDLSKGKDDEVVVVGYGARNKSTESDTTERPRIRIRGQGISGDTHPLYVIDGVVQPKGKLDAIDPNTIESMTVLKDDNARLAYGENGKDGVIIITTKTKDATRKWTPSTKLPVSLRNPIYMVDGEVMSKEAYSKIKESEKKSIATLSNEDAKNYLKFYRNIDLGEHDGLVLIETK
ncbi:TonB-dependent receptor plug domain-containing protein [Sphingobacterium sp. DN00404]|uniref:TonB-dependent receptor plug domain-containing protein n=1 Tax=Sphingobacterium micropteri TaxID=2763501 RepID=A0ABR7YR75_9SPHI|nr:M56 family metallopeptidase [Sphingobacterium micropteri]MBD1433797.1 TonB-dependent receptor plug domain-containing protein [Sphingobacterium micropteri]